MLVFRNVAVMGAYSDALAASLVSGAAPAVSEVRARHAKIGVGISGEQALTPDAGLFGRASWADGKTETCAFAEIDRSISAGVLVKGTTWSRPDDSAGLAIVRNSLSSSHRAYLGAGGLEFFVGDGKLAYRPELIAELFYNYALGKTSHIGMNWQRIANPAYNRDRGPVSVVSARLHADF